MHGAASVALSHAPQSLEQQLLIEQLVKGHDETCRARRLKSYREPRDLLFSSCQQRFFNYLKSLTWLTEMLQCLTNIGNSDIEVSVTRLSLVR